MKELDIKDISFWSATRLPAGCTRYGIYYNFCVIVDLITYNTEIKCYFKL